MTSWSLVGTGFHLGEQSCSFSRRLDSNGVAAASRDETLAVLHMV